MLSLLSQSQGVCCSVKHHMGYLFQWLGATQGLLAGFLYRISIVSKQRVPDAVTHIYVQSNCSEHFMRHLCSVEVGSSARCPDDPCWHLVCKAQLDITPTALVTHGMRPASIDDRAKNRANDTPRVHLEHLFHLTEPQTQE